MIARPPAHPPIFNIPRIVLATIAVLVAIHALREVLDETTDVELLLEFAVIPARWAVAFGGVSADEVLRRLGETGRDGLAEFGRYVLDGNGARPWTPLTYAALHGS